ncbi:hypothetical protein E2C01_091882 [Portunus trituberculatus]|uniref:Uncharacterized protein n=1 Tax=Portunus trituberculatus TaxID=210409 RepID=A0A5B7JQ98_PORTR|nr:hypothetical protein [Portunus trituberculatus]
MVWLLLYPQGTAHTFLLLSLPDYFLVPSDNQHTVLPVLHTQDANMAIRRPAWPPCKPTPEVDAPVCSRRHLLASCRHYTVVFAGGFPVCLAETLRRA